MYQCLLWCEKDHSPWQSRKAQRVSFRAAVLRITKKWALVTVVFHSDRELGVIFFPGLKTKMSFPWDCYSGKFPRLAVEKQELVTNPCLWEQRL